MGLFYCCGLCCLLSGWRGGQERCSLLTRDKRPSHEHRITNATPGPRRKNVEMLFLELKRQSWLVAERQFFSHTHTNLLHLAAHHNGVPTRACGHGPCNPLRELNRDAQHHIKCGLTSETDCDHDYLLAFLSSSGQIPRPFSGQNYQPLCCLPWLERRYPPGYVEVS